MSMFDSRRRANSLAHREPFDVSQLEDEVRATMPTIVPQPAYPAEDLGRITAEAIASQHEAAAQALSALGTELAERIRKIEQLKADAEIALKDCLETAQRYRDEGKRAATQIEEAAELTKEVRETCATLGRRLDRGA